MNPLTRQRNENWIAYLGVGLIVLALASIFCVVRFRDQDRAAGPAGTVLP